MALTDTAIRNVKAREKSFKLFDANGLYLLVSTSGTKSWRFKYRINGKEKLISLGKYPYITLKEARDRAFEYRRAIENGNDPALEKRNDKEQRKITFEDVANEYVEIKRDKLVKETVERIMSKLRLHINPCIGSLPIVQVTAPDILALCRKAEAKNSTFLPHSLRALCSNIFVYAIATGRAERNPANDIKGALKQHSVRNHPALTTPEEIASLLSLIDCYSGTFLTRESLKLLALTFTRSKELRMAEWKEINFEDALWRIPADKMKMRRDHLVPLSRQALEILRKVYLYSGSTRFVFPNRRDDTRCMSNGTFLEALRDLGYSKEELSPHGFRAMASTMLNELGYNADWIERQLAHVPRNIVRGIYNRAEYLPERRKMMQDWADYLDGLRDKRFQELIKANK